jgi:dolichol-phosphate mannosyltransferase
VILIVIPTYNERDNITRLLPELFKALPEIRVLVVDDKSPDGTSQAVRLLIEKYPNLALLERNHRNGLAGAYLAGFRWALKNPEITQIVQMDADFSHAIADVARCIKLQEGDQLVVGSRYIKGGAIVNWDWRRRFLSRFGNYYVRLLLGSATCDWTSGCVVWPRTLLGRMPLNKIDYRGYFFQIALKYYAIRSGATILDVPITFQDRENGESKLHLITPWEAIINVIRIRFNRT